MTFGLYFLASILLMIVGTSLYIPQYYAYSQVEFLLCDTLDLGQAKPGQILKNQPFPDERLQISALCPRLTTPSLVRPQLDYLWNC